MYALNVQTLDHSVQHVQIINVHWLAVQDNMPKMVNAIIAYKSLQAVPYVLQVLVNWHAIHTLILQMDYA